MCEPLRAFVQKRICEVARLLVVDRNRPKDFGQICTSCLSYRSGCGLMGDDCRVLALRTPRRASNGTGAETVGFDFMVRRHMAATGTGDRHHSQSSDHCNGSHTRLRVRAINDVTSVKTAHFAARVKLIEVSFAHRWISIGQSAKPPIN